MTPGFYQATRRRCGLSDLERLAADLAARLRPGDVVALNGPLGAGKTTLVQKLGAALGVQDNPVSPTFVLVHEYTGGSLPLVHADLYRLGEERAHTLADELMMHIEEGRSVMLVEWAQYGRFLDEWVSLTIDISVDSEGNQDKETRTITISSPDSERVRGLDG